MQEEVQRLQSLLSDARAQRDQTQVKAASAAAEVDAVKGAMASQAGSLSAVEKRLQQTVQEFQTQTAALEQMQADRQAARQRVCSS